MEQAAHARAAGMPPSVLEPFQAGDEVDELGDDSASMTSNSPAPKRRKTTKKQQPAQATASTAEGSQRSTHSPPGTTLPELAAVASQLQAAIPAPASVTSTPATTGGAASAPANAPLHAPHVHTHQHPHGHTHSHPHNHALHAAKPHHHHHHHVVSPHSHTAARLQAAPVVALNLDAPLQNLTVRDLVAFRDGLQAELGNMRELIGRTEQYVQHGDRLVGVLQTAIAAAGQQSQQAQQPPQVPARRTEQDLEEYLAGLPTMDALPLPGRQKKAATEVQESIVASSESSVPAQASAPVLKAEEVDNSNTGRDMIE